MVLPDFQNHQIKRGWWCKWIQSPLLQRWWSTPTWAQPQMKFRRTTTWGSWAKWRHTAPPRIALFLSVWWWSRTWVCCKPHADHLQCGFLEFHERKRKSCSHLTIIERGFNIWSQIHEEWTLTMARRTWWRKIRCLPYAIHATHVNKNPTINREFFNTVETQNHKKTANLIEILPSTRNPACFAEGSNHDDMQWF